MTKKSSHHISVMLEECLQYFSGKKLTTFFEGTLGAGGHAKPILEAHPEIERYIACDKDPEALAIAQENLQPWKDKLDLIHGDFGDLSEYLDERNIKTVDGFFLTWGYLLCN